jgi:AMP-binding enzyme
MVITMTTAHAGGLEPAIAAERESIEAEIAGGTLLTAFAETAERHGGTEAYRWRQDGEWRTLTYAGLRDQVRDTALGLAAIGVRPGDFAVIWSRNRPEANIADVAVMHARGVPVFLYNTLAPSQAAYIAGHCEATVAIVEDRGFLARLEAVRSQPPQLRRVVLIDSEPGPGEDWLIAWDAVLALGRAEAGRSPGLFDDTWRQVGPEDLAALIYTSGTTGPPKGVMITHHNVRHCAAAVLRVLPPEEFADEDGRRGISYLPMAHATGRFADHWLPMMTPRWRSAPTRCLGHDRAAATAPADRPGLRDRRPAQLYGPPGPGVIPQAAGHQLEPPADGAEPARAALAPRPDRQAAAAPPAPRPPRTCRPPGIRRSPPSAPPTGLTCGACPTGCYCTCATPARKDRTWLRGDWLSRSMR